MNWRYAQPHLLEVFQVLGQQLHQYADGASNLKELAVSVLSGAVVQTINQRTLDIRTLDVDRVWYLSSGRIESFVVGDRLNLAQHPETRLRVQSASVRLLGIWETDLNTTLKIAPAAEPRQTSTIDWTSVVEKPQLPENLSKQIHRGQYPFKAGRGSVEASSACFEMLAQYWQIPFRKEVVRRVLSQRSSEQAVPTLQLCGAIAELLEIRPQLLDVPQSVIAKLPTPLLMHWENQLVVVYETSAQGVTLAIPESGLKRVKLKKFIQKCSFNIPVLLLEKTVYTSQKKFNLSWFLPAISRFKFALIEVLFISFVVQLFSLANPLFTQIIIDKVLVKNSPDSLNSLGILLIFLAVIEALLSSFRTNLFADTTNRIDIGLGSQVIDHLLKLPLKYFDQRPVGELTTRVNELENIRNFLTGTALNVVLDAVFSIIYIVVMFFYSPLLTLVTLSTIPLFALLTLIVSPLLRQIIRAKAERRAETQSYLVEVLTGAQTVKAQNIELKARWQWQERYSKYVSTGFQAVLTSTTATSISNFLNKVSGLLLLWVGAHLVLAGELTLGELIAFRIIASYITSPLLRLTQLWQNFQEVGLSLERLADVLDYPLEVSELDRSHIPLPTIAGEIIFRQVSFRFTSSVLLLQQIDVTIQPGQLVGFVGLSGSGKSTLMKLLMRLYPLESGQILIDGYDIHKVELYSLRRQIGMVLQDSLLFAGTVQENISLTQPDATSEEIVRAAKLAYAHDFIMALPQGYNTQVGERGSALSGGQRQRIAIARALLQNPRILILDEATSALDYNAERQVLQNLASSFGDRTIIFVTHRLKALQIADQIFMMSQGQIAERGTHADLMALKGLYYCLYQQQEMIS